MITISSKTNLLWKKIRVTGTLNKVQELTVVRLCLACFDIRKFREKKI